MSAYLKHVLGRANIVPCRTIRILRPQQEWAQRQLVDELATLYPEASIALTDQPDSDPCDLLVLPFMDELSELVRDERLRERTKILPDQLVLIYGLRWRHIDLVKGDGFELVLRRNRRSCGLTHTIRRLHTTRVALRLLRGIAPR